MTLVVARQRANSPVIPKSVMCVGQGDGELQNSVFSGNTPNRVLPYPQEYPRQASACNSARWTVENKKAPWIGAFRGFIGTVLDGLKRNPGGVDGTRTRDPRRDRLAPEVSIGAVSRAFSYSNDDRLGTGFPQGSMAHIPKTSRCILDLFDHAQRVQAKHPVPPKRALVRANG